jgi:hypothetical protein
MPSLPEPPENKVLVPMEGMGFTAAGLAHDLNEDDWEALLVPAYAPERGLIQEGDR